MINSRNTMMKKEKETNTHVPQNVLVSEDKLDLAQVEVDNRCSKPADIHQVVVEIQPYQDQLLKDFLDHHLLLALDIRSTVCKSNFFF